MTTMRVCIAEDEPLARQRPRYLLTEIPGAQVVGECGDGTNAVTAIGDLAREVMLLDVQMREMGGFALVDAVGAGRMPPVVLVTAHDQFALRAFDVSAVDCLLKPVQAPQLARALQRAAERRRAADPALGRNLRALLETVRTMIGDTAAAPAAPGPAWAARRRRPESSPSRTPSSTCARTPCIAAASWSRCRPAGTRSPRRWSRGPGEVVTRSQLLRELSGYSSDVMSRTVDMHVIELRRKLEVDPTTIVDSVRLALKLPAVGAAIVTLEDGLAAIGAAGTRRVTEDAAVTMNDLWHLGSNTKAVTSLLAAVAVSQHRIQWTTTIAQGFPELTTIRPEYRDVTLRELLSHQSGLSLDVGDASLQGVTTAVAQRGASVPAALQQASPAGTMRGKYPYNDTGYVVAGTMVERAFGTSFEAAMMARVVAPLGMASANWGPQAAAGSTTQPVAHRRQPDEFWSVLEGYQRPPVFTVPGTMHMSLATWGRFVREVLRVEPGTSTIVPPAVARQTTSEITPVSPGASYGMGWALASRPWANGKTLDHTGTDGGNFSLAVLAPARSVAFLVATNGWNPDSAGASYQAANGSYARLITFHDTGR